ncbi:MAG: enoyl-CoA hydratase/isomerase family protein [Actinobacteria bacterium]|nr:enoyl-CoA hydratase/isomerase family protein [Actinomycetota bacterium]MBU1943762.1 enoyl-CoA hydratase/isomerase family protein [Actinomycetota bacterium]MBU2688786.1 enoyl-CoA hydratase/isomerase family protein [Actinomycetota bacterium]
MDYNTVLYEVCGPGDAVVAITMNRPDQRNAINREMAEELLDAFRRADAEPGAKVILFSGAGKSFCAGGDLSVLPTFDHYTMVDWLAKTGLSIVRAITENDKVVIAKVKGHCIAGGLELALACDLIYASERTKLGVTEVAMGILPGWGGTVRLARCLPIFRGREILLSGSKDYTAREFYDMGLLTRVYAEEEFDAKVDEKVAMFCERPADALRMGKSVMKEAFDGMPLDSAMNLEREAIAWLFHSELVTGLREAAVAAFEAMKQQQQGG